MPTHQYDDILNLPRPVSRRHRPMPLEERAVQFAPFAALTSYEEILMEAARPTRDCPQLSEDEQTRLDARLQQLRGRIKDRLGDCGSSRQHCSSRRERRFRWSGCWPWK